MAVGISAWSADVSVLLVDPVKAGLRVRGELKGALTRVRESSDSGRLRIEDVPAGNYTLWLTSAGFQTKVVRLMVPPSGEVNLGQIQMDLNLGFERAIPEETGANGAIVALETKPVGAKWTLRCRPRKTCGRDSRSGTGGAELAGLRPGRYELRVSAKGHFAEAYETELTDGIRYRFGVDLHECIDPRCKKLPVYL